MKLFVLTFCVYLLQGILASHGDEPDVLQAQQIPLEAQMLTGAPLVEYVKKNQKLFEVEFNPKAHYYEKMLMDLDYAQKKRKPSVMDENDNGLDIPESFDGRVKWAHCPSLFYIRDQSLCGSCWAVSTAAAISDRLCIATNGSVKVQISADDIMTCCLDCGRGCHGGWPVYAFDYFSEDGAVTGGNYGSKDCCRPYEIPPCGWHRGEPYYDCEAAYKGTPPCVKKCQPGYKKAYAADKYYGRSAYDVPFSVQAIQREIMKNGPVVATYTVYQDFVHYKRGIYKHTAGKATGSHAVKIIGWGKEGNTPYWIIANTWHSDWGENGFFRMIRGINDCGIEDNVAAGLVGNGRR